MNNDQVKGNWKQMSGKFKEQWGKITDDELTQAEGRVEYLAGRVQAHYGDTKESAFHSVNEFFKSFEAAPAVATPKTNV